MSLVTFCLLVASRHFIFSQCSPKKALFDNVHVQFTDKKMLLVYPYIRFAHLSYLLFSLWEFRSVVKVVWQFYRPLRRRTHFIKRITSSAELWLLSQGKGMPKTICLLCVNSYKKRRKGGWYNKKTILWEKSIKPFDGRKQVKKKFFIPSFSLHHNIKNETRICYQVWTPQGSETSESADSRRSAALQI